MKDSDKVTLTFGQLKKLVNESMSRAEWNSRLKNLHIYTYAEVLEELRKLKPNARAMLSCDGVWNDDLVVNAGICEMYYKNGCLTLACSDRRRPMLWKDVVAKFEEIVPNLNRKAKAIIGYADYEWSDKVYNLRNGYHMLPEYINSCKVYPPEKHWKVRLSFNMEYYKKRFGKDKD